jgi:hypothetical protein
LAVRLDPSPGDVGIPFNNVKFLNKGGKEIDDWFEKK